jgi:hypothetical protein
MRLGRTKPAPFFFLLLDRLEAPSYPPYRNSILSSRNSAGKRLFLDNFHDLLHYYGGSSRRNQRRGMVLLRDADRIP